MDYDNFLNILRKIWISISNFWEFFRKVLAADIFKAMAPYVVGGFGVFTCALQAYQEIKEIHQTLKDSSLGERKTRIMSSLLIVLLASTGIGLATTLIIAAMGIAISLQAMLSVPLIIPALFTSMSSLILWRTAYIFYQARKKALDAQKNYQNKEDRDTSLEEIEEARQKYKALRIKHLSAERQLIFRTLDVANSAMILMGVFLSSMAGGAASLGMVPVVLLSVGVVLGYVVQGLEYLDKKYDHALTNKLRNGLTKLGEGFESLFKQTKLKRSEDIEMVQLSRPSKQNLHQDMIRAGIINLDSLRPIKEDTERQAAVAVVEEQKVEPDPTSLPFQPAQDDFVSKQEQGLGL